MKKSILLFFLIFSPFVSAQRFDILSGDLKNLKDISEYKVTFDYSNLVVNGFDSEEAYLKDKMGKRDHIEGKAEKFKENWYSDRENKYEPKFINYFNNKFENKEVKVAKNIDAKYTMNVKTTWIYPGYVLGKVEPAKLSAIITVFETENPKNVLVKIKFEKLIGLAYELNSDQGYRIAGAYEKLAKNFTIQLKRFL
ncbi:hypothetical protein SAMN05660845_1695 [Flavobacterium swingsii]|uniref:DUF4468 domain-containing protein n=1 Tax=Flavobacterium swingsii TaxID=498292 RepID=A0A1I0YDU3_9FLAO|nr:hypothetical protein [Flavobacterium swingsii]SFB11525.1 hypothetical protein SAMN05660845_1695 [Flavobacterium swingsii]